MNFHSYATTGLFSSMSVLSIAVMQPLYIVIWCHICDTESLDQRNDDPRGMLRGQASRPALRVVTSLRRRPRICTRRGLRTCTEYCNVVPSMHSHRTFAVASRIVKPRSHTARRRNATRQRKTTHVAARCRVSSSS